MISFSRTESCGTIFSAGFGFAFSSPVAGSFFGCDIGHFTTHSVQPMQSSGAHCTVIFSPSPFIFGVLVSADLKSAGAPASASLP